jgi:hypothetical protein
MESYPLAYFVRSLLLCAFCLICVGCKIQIEVPEGATVVSSSGSYACYSGETCIIDVKTADFFEDFEVVADPGYTFLWWQGGKDSLCSYAYNCRLSTNGFDGNQLLLDKLASGKTFYLRPEVTSESCAPSVLDKGAYRSSLYLCSENSPYSVDVQVEIAGDLLIARGVTIQGISQVMPRGRLLINGTKNEKVRVRVPVLMRPDSMSGFRKGASAVIRHADVGSQPLELRLERGDMSQSLGCEEPITIFSSKFLKGGNLSISMGYEGHGSPECQSISVVGSEFDDYTDLRVVTNTGKLSPWSMNVSNSQFGRAFFGGWFPKIDISRSYFENTRIFGRIHSLNSTFSDVSIELASEGLSGQIRANNFLGETSIRVRQDSTVEALDMTKNYWDTVDPAMIKKRIYDRDDSLDINTQVQFEPFLNQAVPQAPSGPLF